MRPALSRETKYIIPTLGIKRNMQFNSVANALFTKTQQRVLSVMFGKPDKSYYTNEVLRLANMGRGTITRELEKLSAAGILTTTARVINCIIRQISNAQYIRRDQ
jgi:hypothetical protein